MHTYHAYQFRMQIMSIIIAGLGKGIKVGLKTPFEVKSRHSAALTFSFQSLGAATEKALSPKSFPQDHGLINSP